MKLLTKITTLTFLMIGMTTIAQEDNTRMDKVQAIAEKAIINCSEGPQNSGEVTDDNVKKNLALYGDYYKQKSYKDALKFWRGAFFAAPKVSQNLHIRGISMYKKMSKKAEGELKESYIDSALAIYEVRLECFGSSAKTEKSKAIDWYNKRNKGNEKFVFELFNSLKDKYASEGSVNDVPSDVLIPWINMAVKGHKTQKLLTEEDVLNTYTIVSDIADANISAGNDAGKYKGAIDNITETLKKYDYLNCETLIPLAESKYRANPDDESTIIKTYNTLKSGSCTDIPLFTEVMEKLVKTNPSVGLYKVIAGRAKSAGDNTKTIDYYNKAYELSESTEDKTELLLQIAGMYYKQGSYNSAREYANKVLAINPNSGKAYILIGRTYASSGKACSGGVGTGWDAQVVAWVAADTWYKAKSVDSSVSEEAQGLINRYSQYFPSKQDVFYKGLKVGSSYTVDCLGKTTKIRTSD